MSESSSVRIPPKGIIWLIVATVSLILGVYLSIAGFNHLIAGILFAMAVIFICLYYRKKKSIEIIEAMGTLSGIGLTFVGLVLALLDLELGDSEQMRTSILSLLNGIYPAFFSSIAGIFVALWTHWYPSFWKMDDNEVSPADMDIDNQILQELKRINKGQEELKRSFETFAEKMAENNMNALKKVIEDFNTNLQEQFGENFKQLNEAVKDLVVWQANYKTIVEDSYGNLKQMHRTLKSSNEAILTSAEAIDRITHHTAAFQEVAKKLDSNLQELDNTLEKNQETAGTLRQFSENLEIVPRKIEESMKKSTMEAIESLGQNLKGISEALVDDYQQVHKVIKSIHEEQEK